MFNVVRRVMGRIKRLAARFKERSGASLDVATQNLPTESSDIRHTRMSRAVRSVPSSKRLSFPKAAQHNRGVHFKSTVEPAKEVKKRPEVHIDALPESKWATSLDSKLSSLIMRTGQMPTKGKFVILASRGVGAAMMSNEERARLEIQIHNVYDKYKNLFISGVMQQEVAQKLRDAATNSVNRKYVDGSF